MELKGWVRTSGLQVAPKGSESTLRIFPGSFKQESGAIVCVSAKQPQCWQQGHCEYPNTIVQKTMKDMSLRYGVGGHGRESDSS